MGGKRDKIGVNGVGKVDNTLFFLKVVEGIDGVALETDPFRKCFHVTLYLYVRLEIQRCVDPYQVDCAVVHVPRIDDHPGK